MILPTVTIKASNAKGRKIINESDFDPKRHELWSDEPAPSGIDAMTKDELRAMLDEAGADYDARSGVEKLREIARELKG